MTDGHPPLYAASPTFQPGRRHDDRAGSTARASEWTTDVRDDDPGQRADDAAGARPHAAARSGPPPDAHGTAGGAEARPRHQ